MILLSLQQEDGTPLVRCLLSYFILLFLIFRIARDE